MSYHVTSYKILKLPYISFQMWIFLITSYYHNITYRKCIEFYFLGIFILKAANLLLLNIVVGHALSVIQYALDLKHTVALKSIAAYI